MNTLQQRKRAGKIQALNNLGTGTYSTGGEKVHWEYYDRIALLNTTTVQDMFVTPTGQGTKTLADTNTSIGGLLPQGQNFVIRSLAVQYIAKTAITTGAPIQKINEWIDNTIVEFLISNKAPMFQLPLSRILGQSFTTDATMAAATSTMPSQYGVFNGVYKLGGLPLVLAAQTPFKVRFTSITANDASINADQVRLSLCGTLTRAI